MNKEINTLTSKTLDLLPKLDCGACGYKTCIDFSIAVDNKESDLKKCIHVKNIEKRIDNYSNCLSCAGENLGVKLGWRMSEQIENGYFENTYFYPNIINFLK